MKPEYINALKAGVKTALFVFVAGLVGLVTNITKAIIEAVSSASVVGDVQTPDLDFVPGAAWSLVAALLVGLLNGGVRFLQAVHVPLLTQVFDKVFGAIPVYVPENTGAAIKDAGQQIIPGPAPTDHITS